MGDFLIVGLTCLRDQKWLAHLVGKARRRLSQIVRNVKIRNGVKYTVV